MVCKRPYCLQQGSATTYGCWWCPVANAIAKIVLGLASFAQHLTCCLCPRSACDRLLSLLVMTLLPAMQLDKALRDFMAQMRSPSPELTTDSLSDAEEPSAPSEPSPPVQSRYRAVPATSPTRARQLSGLERKGQTEANARAPGHDGPRLQNTPLAAKLPVNQEPVKPVGPGVSTELASTAQTEDTSAVPVAAPAGEPATRQDAAQQTVSSTDRIASHKQDACGQSELPMVPNSSHQSPTSVPTGDRATQTPVRHASPRPLQKAPPGRDAAWSPRYAAQGFEVHSPAQAHRDSPRHDWASPTQGRWPTRQSPSPQWAGAVFDPIISTDSMAAHAEALSVFMPAVPAAPSLQPTQRLPEHSQPPAQRLFGSPPPYGDPQQVMHPPQHLPVDQPIAASQAQQQDSAGHRSTEPALGPESVQEGLQDADHGPAASASTLAGVLHSSGPAGFDQGPAPHSVTIPAFTSSQPTPAEGFPAWLGTPAGVPHMAGPTLHLRAAAPRHDGHLPSHVPGVPGHHPALPGNGYAYTHSQPFLAQQAALHGSAMSRGLEAEYRTAASSAPIHLMQRHQHLPGGYGLHRHVCAGLSPPEHPQITRPLTNCPP